MVIGDNDFGAEGIGPGNRFVSGDTGIASEDEVGACSDEVFHAVLVEAMSFLPSWDAKGRVRSQGTKGLNEQGCGGLAIGVKVAPDCNLLAVVDGLAQARSCSRQIGQVGYINFFCRIDDVLSLLDP